MSRIQQLPPAIKDRLDELLRANISQRAILDQLAPLLDASGEPPVSRSALNRYATRMEQAGRRIREAREAAAAWTAKFGQTPTGDVSAALIEIVRTLTFDLSLGAGEDGAVTPKMLSELALAAQRLERAAGASAARERALRRELAEAAAAEAEKASRTAAAEAGYDLPPQALQAIREQVYGIVDA